MLYVSGRCIKGVKTSQKSKHNFIVPFRESKLTQLFQNALMGNENISIIINLNPSKGMFGESRHALDFSALSKEITIQEKPIQLVPVKNRFSEIIQRDRKTIDKMEIVDIVIDEEKERLEAMVVQLSNVIDQLRAERDLEIKEEKEYVSEMYEKFIKNKTERDNAIKEREMLRLKEK